MGLVTVGFIAGTLLFRVFMTHVAIPRIMKHRSPEIVVLLAIVVLGTVTLIASKIGLPAAIGAFAAGVILGETRWAEQIDTLILPFREVFSAIFFVSLGLLIEPTAIFERPLLIVGLILGLVLLKMFASILAFKAIGMSLKNAAGPAFGLAHVGEFAFVLIMLASTAGVVTESERQIIFAIAGGTLLAAPLSIRWGFKRGGDSSDDKSATDSVHQFDSDLSRAVVIGMGPIGRATASQLNTFGYELSCVDLNPLNLQLFSQQGIAKVIAGDAQSADCLMAAGIEQSNLVIICIPQDEISLRVTALCRSLNKAAVIIVRCRYLHTTNQLRQIGATHVISEEAYAAEELVKLISK
jgi:CPA2 family monovalent cation:H+ antiporter-2